MIKVALDAMGGDNAPGEIVKGAVDAVNTSKECFVYLVGKEDVVNNELSQYTYSKEQIEVVNATEVIETGEPPVMAIRHKKDSSLVKALNMVKNKEADYGVLPIENSSAGIVSENYDLMVEYDNCIVGEQIIQINHALLGLPDAELSDITDVYSHPQALMQCGRYLESHREWEKHSLKNTAMAAKKVKEDGKKHKAAIASSLTADIYGLKVLDECIQDNRMNATRFIIVSGKRVFTSKAEKISICFEGMHESGSLYHMLSHFIYNGINMNHIESRPVQGKNWEYRFFVDFEGNLNDAAVQNALRGLTEETLGLKILGNY